MKQKQAILKILISYAIVLISLGLVLSVLFYINNTSAVQYKFASYLSYLSTYTTVILIPSILILLPVFLVFMSIRISNAEKKDKQKAVRKKMSLSVFLITSNSILFPLLFLAFGLVATGLNRILSLDSVLLFILGFSASGFYSFIQIRIGSSILAKSKLANISEAFEVKQSNSFFGFSAKTNLLVLLSITFSLTLLLDNNLQTKKKDYIQSYILHQVQQKPMSEAEISEIENGYMSYGKLSSAAASAENIKLQPAAIYSVVLLTFFIISGLSLLNLLPHTKEVRHRIKSQQERINSILTGNVEYGQSGAINYNDELGNLSKSINTLLEKFGEILFTVYENTNSVHDISGSLDECLNTATVAIEEMVTTIKQITGNTSMQMKMLDNVKGNIEEMLIGIDGATLDVSELSAFVQETSSAMHETTTSIQTISKNTEQVNQLSERLVAVSKEGSESVKSTVDAILEIEKASEQVSSIVQIISDIASQTNLLSMNASIEAAHAGDKGKGFAVVANEIRKLAEESNSNIAQIRSQIDDMLEKVKTGVTLSKVTDAAFTKIDADINLTTQHIGEVSGALHEQQLGVSEIMTALESMVEKTNEIKEISDDLKDKSEYMHSSMGDLYNLSLDINNATGEQDKGNKEILSLVMAVKDASQKNLSVVENMYGILRDFNLA